MDDRVVEMARALGVRADELLEIMAAEIALAGWIGAAVSVVVLVIAPLIAWRIGKRLGEDAPIAWLLGGLLALLSLVGVVGNVNDVLTATTQAVKALTGG